MLWKATLVDEHRTHSGFTLMEMLIASAIIALIMAMVYGSYAATTQSLQRYEIESTCRKRADLVLRLMTRQIRCAFAPVTEPNDTNSLNNGHVLVVTPPPVFRGNGENPQGEFLTFLTTSGSSAGANMSQMLALTSYQYNPADASLSIRQSQRFAKLTDDWVRILNHVTDLKLEFCDGTRWRPTWDDRQSASMKLPRAVRVGMTVSDGHGGSYQAQATIPIIYHAEAQATGKS
jgi:prepilin-type N-terminal cleavage/methylation domain-containing protein